MAPKAKRAKIAESNSECQFTDLPECVIKRILGFLRCSDIRSSALVNRQFYDIISSNMKEKTYLYFHNLQPEELISVLNTGRKMNEVFFYGKQSPPDVTKILKKFGEDTRILKFAKNDFKFMKVPWNEFAAWLKCTPHVTELDLTNIQIANSSKDTITRILLPKLKKLKCYESFLDLLIAPAVEKLHVQVIDALDASKLEMINKFIKNHFSIRDFSLQVFCFDEMEIYDVPLKLDHLNLHKLALREFRFNPRDVVDILESQKYLIKLHLEDGSLTNEDAAYVRRLTPVFDKILELKSLDKLVIEMPSVGFLNKLQNMPNLKRLSVTNFPQSELKLLKNIENCHLEKLCIENIEYGKKALEKNDIPLLRNLFKDLKTLKIDTTPLFVIQLLLDELKELKVLKMIRNSEVAKKFKNLSGEKIKLPITGLEKIICDSEDFKLRILPIIRVSPQLTHVKIYWDNKNTGFMSMVFDVLEVCSNVKIIEFVHEGTFVKEDMLSAEKHHFTFSYNNLYFEAVVLRKEAKITCRRI